MSELPRRIVSHLRRYLGNRRRAKRARARLTFTLSLSDPRTSSNGSRRLPSLKGHTLDLSATGIALILPAIRIGEHYLVGDDRKLHLKLELPSGPVELNVVPVRYESLEEEENGYLVGTRIIEMNEVDRPGFTQYVSELLKEQVGS
jgi:c-di-GMP-binding flagellar brake protein YcgR